MLPSIAGFDIAARFPGDPIKLIGCVYVCSSTVFSHTVNNARNSYSEESLRELITGDCGNVFKARMK